MKIEYKLKQEDYKNALIELLRKEFWKRFILIFLISLIISLIISEKPINWKIFIITFLISFLGIMILFFGKSLFNIYKTDDLIKKNPLYIGKKSIFLEDDGIILGKENPTKYDWNSIKSIEDLTNYIIVIFQNNTSITINKKELKNEEITNIIGKIKSKIITSNTVSTEKKSKNIYWLGFLGLIPNIGLLIGGILVFMGFKRKDNKLKLIGLASILFTPIFWFLFIQFSNNSETINNSKIKFTNHYLNEIVKDLEYYKSVNGIYPDSLGQLRNQNEFLIDNEMFESEEILENNKPSKFYYKKVGNHYILKSHGQDLKLNTKDDIYPKFKQPKK
jgi:hypothetical protein